MREAAVREPPCGAGGTSTRAFRITGAWLATAQGQRPVVGDGAVLPGRLDSAPEALARERHLGQLDAERAQRVGDRVRDGGRRRQRATLAGSLDAEWIERRRRHHVADLE